MKRLFSTITTAAAMLSIAAGAISAQTAHNTGAAANVNGSFQDSKWQVSVDGGANWYQALQVQSPPSPPWESNTTAYSWISATSTGSGGGGSYLFRSFFDLTGYNAATATMSFQCAIDNEVPAGVYFGLNGGIDSGICGSGNTTGFKFAGMQTVTSGFVNGMNVIQFQVSGDSQTDGMVLGNVSIRADVATVPEPATVLLMATGLLGVVGMARRRTARAA